MIILHEYMKNEISKEMQSQLYKGVSTNQTEKCLKKTTGWPIIIKFPWLLLACVQILLNPSILSADNIMLSSLLMSLQSEVLYSYGNEFKIFFEHGKSPS